MAIKKIEYQLGLDASGVSKTTKGVETEVKAMGKAFEQLSKIKAFAKAGDDLKGLETKLSAAKVKAAELGVAAESGGKKQQAAYQAAVKDVNKLTTSISTQTNTLAQQSTALKASGVNTKKLTAEQLRAERAYKATASQVKATAKLQSAYADLGIKSSKQYRAEIALQEAARKRIAASGKASSADLARADAAAVTTIKRLKAEMAGMPSTARAAAGGVNDLVTSLGGFATVQKAVDVTLMGISSYGEFDDQLRRTKAAAGATAAEFDLLKNRAIELGRAPGLTATDMASGMAAAAQAGQNFGQIMASVAANAQLATGSELDFGESVKLTTGLLATFGLKAKDTQAIVDTVIGAANSASTNAGEMGLAFSYAGATSDALGISVNKVAAQYLVLANSQLQADRGGIALRAIWGVLLLKSKQFKEKFNIDVSTFVDGKEVIRDLADIIDDLAKSNMGAIEKTELFGKVAGPGISILLKQGGDAIRNYEKKLDNAGGTGKKVSTILQEGLGGKAIRAVISTWEILTLQMVDSVVPTLISIGQAIAGVLDVLSRTPKPIMAGALALSALSAALVAGVSAMSAWAVVGPTVTASATAMASGIAAFTTSMFAGVAATAATAVPLVALAAAGWQTVSVYKQMEEAQLQATQSTARADAGLIKNRLTLAKISRESGIVVTSYGAMRQAFDEGKISYNAATKTYLAGSSKQVAATKSVTAAATNSYQVIEAASGEALAKMQAEWQVYADKVVAINDSIINRQTSLVDKLRAMGRTTMDAGAAWKDLRKEADGYLASAAAAKDAGNLEQTIKEADKAALLFERLNGEVKEGDKVLVSQAKALKTSMAGVEAAAELSIAALDGQKKAAEESADALNKQAGFALGDNYTEAGKAAKLLNEQAKEYNELLAQSSLVWDKVWTNMASSAKKPIAETNASIDNMARDRYLTLHITEIKGQQHGGLVGVAAMANGGRVHHPMDARHGMHFSGYGGGDRWQNHIIAEDGEYMIPKEPVRKGGLALARAYKQQDWQGMAKQLRPMLQVPPSLSQIRRAAPAHVAAAPGQNLGPTIGRVIIEDRNIGVTYSQYMTAADYALLQRSQQSQAEIKARIDK